ncbi:hypothetical protein LSH36_449g03046 [Paralvinella palmiformis]|uniref:Uncharacterized protein n=1 Tax=Paralvinella palmiformis TaxID=53620 RepID=A0AAD9MXW7_9ANNE|nr:hypothetical protein LSH36_449g03046 [Paralvinella palmiformis]
MGDVRLSLASSRTNWPRSVTERLPSSNGKRFNANCHSLLRDAEQYISYTIPTYSLDGKKRITINSTSFSRSLFSDVLHVSWPTASHTNYDAKTTKRKTTDLFTDTHTHTHKLITFNSITRPQFPH